MTYARWCRFSPRYLANYQPTSIEKEGRIMRLVKIAAQLTQFIHS